MFKGLLPRISGISSALVDSAPRLELSARSSSSSSRSSYNTTENITETDIPNIYRRHSFSHPYKVKAFEEENEKHECSELSINPFDSPIMKRSKSLSFSVIKRPSIKDFKKKVNKSVHFENQDQTQRKNSSPSDYANQSHLNDQNSFEEESSPLKSLTSSYSGTSSGSEESRSDMKFATIKDYRLYETEAQKHYSSDLNNSFESKTECFGGENENVTEEEVNGENWLQKIVKDRGYLNLSRSDKGKLSLKGCNLNESGQPISSALPAQGQKLTETDSENELIRGLMSFEQYQDQERGKEEGSSHLQEIIKNVADSSKTIETNDPIKLLPLANPSPLFVEKQDESSKNYSCETVIPRENEPFEKNTSIGLLESTCENCVKTTPLVKVLKKYGYELEENDSFACFFEKLLSKKTQCISEVKVEKLLPWEHDFPEASQDKLHNKSTIQEICSEKRLKEKVRDLIESNNRLKKENDELKCRFKNQDDVCLASELMGCNSSLKDPARTCTEQSTLECDSAACGESLAANSTNMDSTVKIPAEGIYIPDCLNEGPENYGKELLSADTMKGSSTHFARSKEGILDGGENHEYKGAELSVLLGNQNLLSQVSSSIETLQRRFENDFKEKESQLSAVTFELQEQKSVVVDLKNQVLELNAIMKLEQSLNLENTSAAKKEINQLRSIAEKLEQKNMYLSQQNDETSLSLKTLQLQATKLYSLNLDLEKELATLKKSNAVLNDSLKQFFNTSFECLLPLVYEESSKDFRNLYSEFSKRDLVSENDLALIGKLIFFIVRSISDLVNQYLVNEELLESEIERRNNNYQVMLEKLTILMEKKISNMSSVNRGHSRKMKSQNEHENFKYNKPLANVFLN
ncbi:uncharacterized protein PRCAT00005258001 [Priceomyces carsonii]|uniref:uncharacterized protein n=1 Tax=Priceomyces carsonii TaxID=28549 RepID=UPI002EDA1CB2|nr:unnamed protein product [Priceomyces carsonii]